VLNFRNLNIIFLSLLFGSYFLWNITWFLLFVFPIYIGIIAWGSFDIRSNFFLKTIIKGNKKDSISITFDDGPHPEYTPNLLDLLKENGIKATFFFIGKNAEKYPDIVKRVVKEKHLVGNHTYTHTYNWGFLPTKKVMTEIQKSKQVLEDLTGEEIIYFRPPFGVTNPRIAKVIRKFNYHVVGWNVRSLDTLNKTASEIFERVKRKLKGSDVVLFHDTSENTLLAVKSLIDFCKENGIKIVSLEENLKA